MRVLRSGYMLLLMTLPCSRQGQKTPFRSFGACGTRSRPSCAQGCHTSCLRSWILRAAHREVAATEDVPAASPCCTGDDCNVVNLTGDTAEAAAVPQPPQMQPELPPRMGTFDKYLIVWVLLCMVLGGVIGYFAPSVATALASAQCCNGS